MLNMAKKIEKLIKFIIKALNKAIKAGNKIIAVYAAASDEVERLSSIIGKLQGFIDELQTKTEETEDAQDTEDTEIN